TCSTPCRICRRSYVRIDDFLQRADLREPSRLRNNRLVRLPFLFLLAAAAGYAASPLVDRVGKTAFVQIEADSFNSLTPKQQALAYWLSQASIAINPIIYDQESRFGLRQKRVLEAVVA